MFFLLVRISCGERGIRTPGASQHDGFQDRCNRPLYHLSERLVLTAFGLKSGAKVIYFFGMCKFLWIFFIQTGNFFCHVKPNT